MTVPNREVENPGYRGVSAAAADGVLASQQQVIVGWWHFQVTRHVISSTCAGCRFSVCSAEQGGLLISKVLCGF